MIKGYELIEKMYSEIDEYEDTRLYSTGNDELDDLLERAFCEGYEYAQHEFSRKDEEGLQLKKSKDELRGIRGGISLYLNYARKRNNLQREIGETTNKILGGIGKNTASKVKKVAPEVKSKMNEFTKTLKDTSSEVSDRLKDSRDKKHSAAIKVADVAAGAARKFVGVKDKIRKRLRAAADAF